MSWRFTRNETAQELGERLQTGLLAQRRQADHDFEASITLVGFQQPEREKSKIKTTLRCLKWYTLATLGSERRNAAPRGLECNLELTPS